MYLLELPMKMKDIATTCCKIFKTDVSLKNEPKTQIQPVNKFDKNSKYNIKFIKTDPYD